MNRSQNTCYEWFDNQKPPIASYPIPRATLADDRSFYAFNTTRYGTQAVRRSHHYSQHENTEILGSLFFFVIRRMQIALKMPQDRSGRTGLLGLYWINFELFRHY